MPLSFAERSKIKVKAAYTRITLTRVTIAFFLFSFVHCFAQGIIQSFMLSIDSEFGHLLDEIVHTAEIPFENITFLEGSLGHLRLQMCNDIPHGQSPYPCMDIFRSDVDVHNVTGSNISLSTINPGPHLSAQRNKSNGITVIVHSEQGPAIALIPQCAQILVYPAQELHNFRREDVTWIVLQFWLFAVSVIALVSDSVPHTLTVLGARALATGWSMYAIWRSRYWERKIQQLVSDPGTPCSVDLFPSFFPTRLAYEIADLVLNCTALLIAGYLSWTLLRVYTNSSFKCVGAPKHITRIHKFCNAVQACLQLELFVLTAAMSLWLDQLLNTALRDISAHTVVYDALVGITTVLLVPWITLGWYAIHREMKRAMVAFIGIALFYFIGWGLMFYSIIYRWTFVQWPLLSGFTVVSFILLAASISLGLICRMNFGKGLAEYLHAESVLESSNFAPEVFEHDVEKSPTKFDEGFSLNQPLPTSILRFT